MDEKTTANFIEELTCQFDYENKAKHSVDIIIVVHNQLDYIKKCVETLYENTVNFKLYIWDNASDKPTADYLKELSETKNNVHLERSVENLGFIKPNNILASRGSSDYLILLNSDTEVYKGWDTAMIGWLINKTEYGQVGYLGGLLDEHGQGGKARAGDLIDYVCGWCACMARTTYKENGLFDENLVFAYGEDADLSLRLQDKGWKLRALHLGLVLHHGNATINEVRKTRDCKQTFDQNHDYIRRRWKNYLLENRAVLKEIDATIEGKESKNE
jgi:GT2 family glycosyltransferase